MTRITKVQQAALMKLTDGKWHLLAGFARKTRRTLLNRGLVAVALNHDHDDLLVNFRITSAGREALGLVPCPPV